MFCAIGSPPVGTHFESLCQDGEVHSHTGNTTETTLKSVEIPAGLLGAKGVLKIRLSGTVTGNNDEKTLKLYFGAEMLHWVAIPANPVTQEWVLEVVLFNMNDVTEQVSPVKSWVSGAIDAIYGWVRTSQDTQLAKNVILTVQLGNSADTGFLRTCLIEVSPLS